MFAPDDSGKLKFGKAQTVPTQALEWVRFVKNSKKSNKHRFAVYGNLNPSVRYYAVHIESRWNRTLLQILRICVGSIRKMQQEKGKHHIVVWGI